MPCAPSISRRIGSAAAPVSGVNRSPQRDASSSGSTRLNSGNASIARQEGRVKDAEATILQVKASGGACVDASSTYGTAVVAVPPRDKKTAVIPRRWT